MLNSTQHSTKEYQSFTFIIELNDNESALKANEYLKDGKKYAKYPLSQRQFNAFPFLVADQVLNSSIHAKNNFSIQVQRFVPQKDFEILLQIINDFQGNIPQPLPVKSQNAEQFVGSMMFKHLKKLSPQQLKKLYLTCHYLSMKNMRFNIAAMLAAMVYVEKLQCFDKLKKKFGIEQEFNQNVIRDYRNTYSFLNIQKMHE